MGHENNVIDKGVISKVEFQDGEVHYYLGGKLHRTDGPAYVNDQGDEEWYTHGKRHREDGPAVTIGQFGRAEFWVEGEIHREDGPARTDMYGNEEWYTNGKRHRVGGPAITKVDKDGDIYIQEWWHDGNKVGFTEKDKTVDEDCKPCGEEKEASGEKEQPEEEKDNLYLAHYHIVEAEKALVEYENRNGENPEYTELFLMLKIIANRFATYRSAGIS